MRNFLEFEKPIAELEGKIEELKHLGTDDEINIAEEVGRLQIKAERLLRQTYGKLTPWQKVQVARHPDRPHTSNYIGDLLADFTPLAGDRRYADDHAIIGGLGRLHGYTVMAIGTEKGNDTESRLRHNFGMARPEGYRKAQRLMRLAEHLFDPGRDLHRYLGRLSRRRRRGTRAGRGHRPIDRSQRRAARAGDRGHHWRGRLRRRHCARFRRPVADARTRDFLGDFARRLRLHSVARRSTYRGGGAGAGPHLPGSVA